MRIAYVLVSVKISRPNPTKFLLTMPRMPPDSSRKTNSHERKGASMRANCLRLRIGLGIHQVHLQAEIGFFFFSSFIFFSFSFGLLDKEVIPPPPHVPLLVHLANDHAISSAHVDVRVYPRKGAP